MKRSHPTPRPNLSTATRLAVFAVATLLLGAQSAWAQAVQLPIQGFLTNDDGTPTDGLETLVVAVVDDPGAGTVLYTEDLDVEIANGFFTTYLGTGGGLDASVFVGGDRFLSITVDGDELLPRTALPPTPYAIIAENVIGDIEPRSVSIDGAVVIDENGDWVGDIAGLQGPQGPEGPQGPIGPQGAPGETGPAGPPGLPGAQGPAGPQGPQGPAGAQGPAGPQGPEGPQGPAGADGATGAQGPQGERGEAGPEGPQGPQGVAGPQGPAGPEGPQGPTGPQGLPGAPGADGADGVDGRDGERGPPGPSGFIGMNFASGESRLPAIDVADFVSPTVLVRLQFDEAVHFTATASLGTDFEFADRLDLYPCFQATDDEVPTVIGKGVRGIELTGPALDVYTLSGVLTDIEGTFAVGLCGVVPRDVQQFYPWRVTGGGSVSTIQGRIENF